MKTSSARSAVMLTVLIMVVILAAAWFLLISPVMTATSEANASAEQQENTNANTQLRVNTLRAQFENMAEYEAQLAELQIQIPPTQEYANLQRLFAEVARQNSVVITKLEFGVATRFEKGGDVVPEENVATTEPAPEAPAEGTDGAPVEPAEEEIGDAQYSIPVKVELTGAYDDVLSALNQLQTGTARIVLVTTVELSPSDVTVADAGNTTAVFGGEAFVLTNSRIETDSPDDEAPSDTSPSPSPSPSPSN